METKEVAKAEESKEILNPIERQEAVLKSMTEQVDKYEKLVKANQEAAATVMLSGSAGGHVETPQASPEDAAKNAAKDFFKGTPLEEAIEKHG
jgi:hypothetical protein